MFLLPAVGALSRESAKVWEGRRQEVPKTIAAVEPIIRHCLDREDFNELTVDWCLNAIEVLMNTNRVMKNNTFICYKFDFRKMDHWSVEWYTIYKVKIVKIIIYKVCIENIICL
jgi:hypothetical protein